MDNESLVDADVRMTHSEVARRALACEWSLLTRGDSDRAGSQAGIGEGVFDVCSLLMSHLRAELFPDIWQ
jgi:hypothetical protein